jgi:type III secretory pathway component EscS
MLLQLKDRRKGFIVKTLFVAIVLIVTASALCDRGCCNALCEEALKGTAAGLLYGLASIVSGLNSKRVAATLSWRVIRHELRVGLVAGFLIGLVVALARFVTGG